MINQTTQWKELADGKARNRYNLYRTCRRIEHPAWHLEGAAMRLPDQEIMNTVVLRSPVTRTIRPANGWNG
jgi:hypothetical protein